MSFKDHINWAREKVNNSRSASEEAKTLSDAGYGKLQDRDRAVEELRLGVEFLAQALDILEARLESLEQRVPRS